MGKNTEMLKSFFKVLKNDKEEINKILPDIYSKSFYTIDIGNLKKRKISNLILDIDGTILPTDDIRIPQKLEKRIKELKDNNINICLMSNNSESRVKPVANKLKVKYLANAKKPLFEAFDKALKILNVKDKSKIAMVGDQMMSDIKGANEYGIYSILVKPISNKNNLKTATSRFLQNIMEKNLKKKNIFDNNCYYNEKPTNTNYM